MSAHMRLMLNNITLSPQLLFVTQNVMDACVAYNISITRGLSHIISSRSGETD